MAPNSRSQLVRFAIAFAAAIVAPDIASAGWGDEVWGVMVWGQAPTEIPALSLGGLAGLAVAFLLTAVVVLRRQR